MLQERMFDFAMLGSEWVLWLLVIMSAVCVSIALERTIFLALNSTPKRRLEDFMGEFLSTGDAQQFKNSLGEQKGVETRILLSGLTAAEQGGLPAAEEAIAGHLLFERIKMERGLIVIGTTGSNAPFIGLFGTVLGIIRAFADLANASAEAAESVMAGISEALVATAIGLLVAIPAVVLYNYFQRRIKTQLSTIESISHMMLSRLQSKKEA